MSHVDYGDHAAAVAAAAAGASGDKRDPRSVPRPRKSINQISVLEQVLARETKPKKSTVVELMRQTGLTYAEIRNWFRNQRLKYKMGRRNMPSLDPTGALQVAHMHGAPQGLQGLDGMAMPRAQDLMGGRLDKGKDNEAPVTPGKGDDKFRASAKFKRTKEEWITTFNEYPEGTKQRQELLRELIRGLSKEDRNMLQTFLRPRGPYRGSADATLSKSTQVDRSKEAWTEMERRFGASKTRENKYDPDPAAFFNINPAGMPGLGGGPSQMQNPGSPGGNDPARRQTVVGALDSDMLEGLKQMFSLHRDYLYEVARALNVTDIMRQEIEIAIRKDVKKELAIKQKQKQKEDKMRREKRKAADQLENQLVKQQRTMVQPAMATPMYQMPQLLGAGRLQ
eukprot:Opistho-2@3084